MLLETPGQSPRDLESLTELFCDLNVPMAAHKGEGTSNIITFLGITLNTNLMVASLPQEKLDRIRWTIHNLVRSPVCARKDLQSLLGMLNFAMRIIPQGRSFVSRLLSLLPLCQNTASAVSLQANARADLLMWDQFLCNWNGISMFIHLPTAMSPRIFTDAAASVAFAEIFGCQ